MDENLCRLCEKRKRARKKKKMQTIKPHYGGGRIQTTIIFQLNREQKEQNQQD